jgi:hypothetical protein
MIILKFSRAPQNPSEGTKVPAGIRLAIPRLGRPIIHISYRICRQ